MVTIGLPKNSVWWGSMHTISSYRGNRPTNPPSNTARTSVANSGVFRISEICSPPLPSLPSLPPFTSYVQWTLTVCIMYINYRSSMPADVSFVTGLLLDIFQLQVNCLNVNQFLLCSFTQTVALCNAHQITLLFFCNSKVICFFLQSLCIFL